MAGQTAPVFCSECGAKIVEYKHGLSKGLMRSLAKLANAGGGPLNIADDLKLTKSEYTNFGKLKYWQLIEKTNPEVERGGIWMITQKGLRFIKGESMLQHYVWTYRNQVIRYDGEHLSIETITDGWKYRPQYAREAVPH